MPMKTASPPSCTLSSLLLGDHAAAKVVESAFSNDSLGLILVELDGDDAREHCLDAASVLGHGMESEPETRVELLKTLKLGSDVPAAKGGKDTTPKGNTFSTTLQMKFSRDDLDMTETAASAEHVEAAPAADKATDALPRLPVNMRRLGLRMAVAVRAVARVCDHFLFPEAEESEDEGGRRCCGEGVLERALVESETAKARLIHYRSARDSDWKPGAVVHEGPSGSGSSAHEELASLTGQHPSIFNWQHFHYDYGLFTAICAPRYTLEASGIPREEVRLVTDEITSQTERYQTGLVVLKRTRTALKKEEGDDALCFEPVLVPIPRGFVAVQVGEAAQILSGGRLVATPHCVARPRSQLLPTDSSCAPLSSSALPVDRISRQIFVVFLQPGWQVPMRPAANSNNSNSGVGCGAGDEADNERVIAASKDATEALAGIVPPLHERWRPVHQDSGAPFTFSDFSKATTAAYFGTKGAQRGGSGGDGKRR